MRVITTSLLFIVSLLASCVTVKTKFPPEATAEELFFQAQVQQGQIKTKKDYEAVIGLFQSVIDKFPQYKAMGVECQYEIAYLLYNQKKYRESQELFFSILKTYETNNSDRLPDWVQILSQKMVDKIDEKLKPKKKPNSKKKE